MKLPVQTVGDYDILEKIADGGMGSVYKARARSSGNIVAVKILSAHLTSNQVLLKRFEQEYNAAKVLDHPNIVRALAFGYNGTTPYLVMEYVDGESLGQKIEREGKLPEAEAVRIMIQVAKGLHLAHQRGMVHRDIKPDNILLNSAGQAKLTDLGLVKELEADMNLTRTGRGLGTPHFMSPEQFRNAKNADVRCDIYSMAATLYMMVTGELPFKSLGPLDAWMKKIENKIAPPRELVPALSERIDIAIRRAMTADPSVRPATCLEFIEDLTTTNKQGAEADRAQLEMSKPDQEVWYLRYTDDVGAQHMVRGTTNGIRKSLKEGVLGDASDIRAARSKIGPFEPLKSFKEFRDHVTAAVLSSSSKVKISASAPPAAGMDQTIIPTRTAVENTPAPHIDICRAPEPEPAGDGGKVAFLLVLAVAAGAAGFFLLPRLFGG